MQRSGRVFIQGLENICKHELELLKITAREPSNFYTYNTNIDFLVFIFQICQTLIMFYKFENRNLK